MAQDKEQLVEVAERNRRKRMLGWFLRAIGMVLIVVGGLFNEIFENAYWERNPVGPISLGPLAFFALGILLWYVAEKISPLP